MEGSDDVQPLIALVDVVRIDVELASHLPEPESDFQESFLLHLRNVARVHAQDLPHIPGVDRPVELV